MQQPDPATNRRRAVLLAGMLGAAVGVCVLVVVAIVLSLVAGAPIGLVVGLLAGVVAGTLAAVRAERSADDTVLAAVRARAAGPDEEPRLHNLVEGLCAAAGLSKPAVLLVDDPAPNALVAGRDRHHGALVVTTGLLRTLERIELEGVVAHELSRLRALETAPATVAVTTVGRPLLAAERPGGAGRLLAPLAPLSAGLVGRVAAGTRQPDADLQGVALTRYPPGLLAALEKLAGAGTVVAGAPAVTDHLWLAPAAPDGPLVARLRAAYARPGLEDRIEALREL